jgi:hypothetical protein
MSSNPKLEYSQLYESVVSRDPNDDIYSEVMAKSDKVLDTINRVVESEENKKGKKGYFQMPLYELFQKTIETFIDIVSDVAGGPPSNDDFIKWIVHVFMGKGRLFYIGVFVFVASVLAILLYEM